MLEKGAHKAIAILIAAVIVASVLFFTMSPTQDSVGHGFLPELCGDGVCDPLNDEDAIICPVDCEVFCGNGICEEDESEDTCFEDCFVGPDSDLVIDYNFNTQADNGENINDDSVHFNHGTLFGGEVINGIIKTGLFLGGDDYIALSFESDSLDFFGSSISVSAWIKEEGEEGNGYIVCDESIKKGYLLYVNHETGMLTFRIGDGTFTAVSYKLPDEEWHHVSGVYNSDTKELELYVDIVDQHVVVEGFEDYLTGVLTIGK